MRDGCPFCDYAGPSKVVKDYGDVYVIEPIDPVAEGHLLVIPKAHIRDATSGPTKVVARVFEVASLEADWTVGGPCNIITSIGKEATQTVMHLHVHLVPRREGDGLMLPWSPAPGPEKMFPFDPDYVVSPGATLADWIEATGFNTVESYRHGIPGPVLANLLLGHQPLTYELAGKLEAMTNVSATFWIARERGYRDGLAAGKKRVG